MREMGTRDARIREQLGAWWAQEFPHDVLPTEALIRLSERLATFDMFDEPAPSPSAEEEARELASYCAGMSPAHVGVAPALCAEWCDDPCREVGCRVVEGSRRITTALAKRSEEAYRLGELAEAAHHADCCVDRERLAHLEACLAAGEAAKTVLLGDALRAVVEAARDVAALFVVPDLDGPAETAWRRLEEALTALDAGHPDHQPPTRETAQ